MLRTAKQAILGAFQSAGYDIVKRGTAVPTIARPPAAAPVSAAPETPPHPLGATKRAPAEFRDAMARYEASYPIQDGGDPIVEALARDGLCIVPDFLPSELVSQIHDQALPIGEGFRSRKLTGPNRHRIFDECGFLRVNSPENLAPLTAAFFDHPRIHSVVRSYLSGSGRRMERYLDYKHSNRLDTSVHPHFDNIYRMLKVFFYLNDIPDTHAPFTMWKRSHLKRPWRELPDYLYFADHPYGWGVVPLSVASTFGKGEHSDIERVECTARAGTAIFCDVSAVHSASLLRDGYRLMLVDNWMMQDNGKWLNPYHAYATPPEGLV